MLRKNLLNGNLFLTPNPDGGGGGVIILNPAAYVSIGWPNGPPPGTTRVE